MGMFEPVLGLQMECLGLFFGAVCLQFFGVVRSVERLKRLYKIKNQTLTSQNRNENLVASGCYSGFGFRALFW